MRKGKKRVRRCRGDRHGSEDRPICYRCSKRLVWTFTEGAGRRPHRGMHSLRVSYAKYRRVVSRNRSRIVIRCLDCFGTFCPACARKHFAPMMQAMTAIERKVQRLMVDATVKISRDLRARGEA